MLQSCHMASHAEVVVDDHDVFSIFNKHCKKLITWHNCIPDEHYISMILTMRGLEKELERRTLTYTLWNASAKRTEIGWHPVTFSYASATLKRMKEIKSGGEASIVAEVVEVEENSTDKMQTLRTPPLITINKIAAYALYELTYIRHAGKFRLDG